MIQRICILHYIFLGSLNLSDKSEGWVFGNRARHTENDLRVQTAEHLVIVKNVYR